VGSDLREAAGGKGWQQVCRVEMARGAKMALEQGHHLVPTKAQLVLRGGAPTLRCFKGNAARPARCGPTGAGFLGSSRWFRPGLPWSWRSCCSRPREEFAGRGLGVGPSRVWEPSLLKLL